MLTATPQFSLIIMYALAGQCSQQRTPLQEEERLLISQTASRPPEVMDSTTTVRTTRTLRGPADYLNRCLSVFFFFFSFFFFLPLLFFIELT